jgi:transposase
MDNASDQHRHQDRHQGDEYRRIELITGRARRRRWTPEEKARILTESLMPGASVSAVARRHNVSRGLLSAWRREAMRATDDLGPRFVPLRLSEEGAVQMPAGLPGNAAVAADSETAPEPVPGSTTTGMIEIELGRARVRIQGAVDGEALRQVLAHVGRPR